MEEGAEGIYEVKNGEECCELSPGYAMVAHINLQQSWLPTKELYKIKPVKNSSMERGEAFPVSLPDEELM